MGNAVPSRRFRAGPRETPARRSQATDTPPSVELEEWTKDQPLPPGIENTAIASSETIDAPPDGSALA